MKIKFTLSRTTEWLKEQAILTGENMPREVDVMVDTQELDQELRARLLTYWREDKFLGDIDRIKFNNSGEINSWSSYGSRYLYSTVMSPTSADAIAALEATWALVVEECAKIIADIAERERREKAAKEEEDRKEKELAAAKVLLADDLAKLVRYAEHREILSQVISELDFKALETAAEEAGIDWDVLDAACSKRLPSE